jgi:hypothetical protein
MISREEIVGLTQGLPLDETWLPLFMERLKELSPEIHAGVVAAAQVQLEELTKQEKNT